MYSVHVVVLFFSCNLCLVSPTVNMKNLLPIASKRAEIRHKYESSGINFPLDGSCMSLPKLIKNQTASLYVDLFTDYPIHLVILRGKLLSARRASISVRIDGTFYKNVLFSNEIKFSYTPVPSGRVLAISTDVKINVCFVEIYTCMLGKTGSQCNQDCAPGFYGLSCKEQCECVSSTPCDRTTGVCPSGCSSASQGASEPCYYPVVKAAHLDIFSATETTATSIIQGPSKDLMSTKVYKASEPCITVKTECASKSLYLEMGLTKPIALYGVEMTFTEFYLPAPFAMYITSDGKPCYGLTSNNNSLELRKHIFKCHRSDTAGKYILVRFSTYNKTSVMNVTGVGIHVCKFKALECSSGFYGPNCRQVCSCVENDCDKTTGMCPKDRCSVNSKGPYCSSINILPNANVVRKKHYDSRSATSQSQVQTSAPYSWLAIEFDGVYTINSFTLTLADDTEDPHRSVQVIMDPNISIDNTSMGDYLDLPGLPCVVKDPGKGQVTHHLTCPGLARTVVLVVVSDSSFLDVSSADIQVWTCVDGMFGASCEQTCNCKNTLERCDKISGSCLSGCARGYKGKNCLQACRKNDPDPTCPTQTCHCMGIDQADCGPEVALCTSGCQAGWMGLSCTLPCPIGYFGVNCEEKCGNCLYGNQTTLNMTRTCLPTNGTCLLGCADPNDTTEACRIATDSPTQSRTSRARLLAQSFREARYQKVLEIASVRVILGLVGMTLGCATLVILVCCSLKCYWDRVAHNKRLNEKRVEMVVRRAMNSKMDKQLRGDHQAFHEAFMKRDIMKKLGEKSRDSQTSKALAKAKAEAIRLMIVEMEAQRRINKSGAEPENEEDEEQDPDQKVAFWILKQDFSELIDRRKKRLREYQGNILHITESPYRISDVSLIPDIHKLYDDVENLGIP